MTALADVRPFRSRRADAAPALRVVPDAPPTADELLVDVAGGDRDAFSALYDLLSPRVFGIAKRVLRDSAQAEEVTQEVMLEVWRQAARFDSSRGSAATWVTTMAHRRAVDRVRSAQAASDRDERSALRQDLPSYDVVAEEVVQRLEEQQVRAALNNLTDLQREAVTLAYFGGYTYREVAVILDVPLGTVKTRLRDGLIRLRDAMGVHA